MKQQKCRLCGHEHAIRDPHIWDERSIRPAEAAPKPQGAGKPDHRTKPPAGIKKQSDPQDEQDPGARRDSQPIQGNKPVFDRSEYQRLYMQKWRAKRTAELKRLRELVGEK